MPVPRSLRIARLLLFAAGAMVVGLVAYIGVQSRDPGGAWQWIGLLLVNAAGFFVAAWLLTRDEQRARLLATGSAVAMAGLGTITGFGAGMLSFPAAGLGVLGAWAAWMHPPRRPVVLAFVAYAAIGVAIAGPSALLFPVFLPTIFIWPARLLFFLGPAGFFAIYLPIGIGASIAATAFVPRRAALSSRSLEWALAFGIAVVTGVIVVVLFELVAQLRPNTSARFELDPLVLAVVFLGGAIAALGVLAMRLRPGIASAASLGLGATMLFLTFTYRPAVTCEPQGNSTGIPLSWILRASIGAAPNYAGSGSTSSSVSAGTYSNGEFRSGDRVATYRCEAGQLVEYREEKR